MSYADDMDALPVFYIGQHESKRALDVSAELVQHAQDLGVCRPCCPCLYVSFALTRAV
jgi:hypothetical protein